MAILRFLLLEDKSLDTEAIQAVLTNGGIDYKLLWVDTRADFVTALKTQVFDLILAAYMMPGFDGIAALEIACNLCPDVPFIFISASLGEELAIETLKRGATDYVLKQRLERLVPCVQRALREAQERKRAKAALRQSEAKNRTLFESIDEGFCICEMLFDENGEPHDYRFLEVNPLFEAMTGLERATGKTARELVPTLEAHWFKVYGSVVLTGKPVRFENQSVVMNRWFNVNAFRIGEPQSNQFAILFSDISDRKKVEQERSRFLAVGSDLQVIAGINGYFQWVSPTFERTLGWTLGEMTSRPWTDFIHPDDIGESVSETDSLFSGNETIEFENRYRHKDGSYRWFLWNAQPYPEEQVFYGAAVDITERKRAELNAEFLANVSQDLVEATCVDEMVQTVGEQLNRYLNISSCAFVEINETKDEAAIQYDWHQDYVPSLVGVYPLPEFVSNEFLQTAKAGQAIIVRDVTADPRIAEQQRFAALNIGSFINIPFIRDDEWKFTLGVYHQTPYYWRIDEIELMRELSARIWNRLERTRAEAALRESEARLQRAITIETVGVIFFRTDGHITDANDTFLRMSGYSRKDLEQGRVRWDIQTPPEFMTASLKAINEFLATGRTTPYEKEYLRKDGSRWWGLFAAQRLNDAEGVEFIIDITAAKRDEVVRKQAEAALRESEARLRFMLNASQIGEWDLDLTTQPYTAHRSLRHDQIFGYESLLPEWSYEILLTHVHPDDRTFVNEKFQQTLSASTAWNFECRIIHADQSVHWIWVRSSVYCDQNGTPTRLLGMVVDITERKQAEATMRQSEERYRFLVTTTSSMVWIANSAGEITEDVPWWETFTGQTPEQYKGYGWLDAVHPDDRQPTTEIWTRSLQTKTPLVVEYRVRRHDGHYRYMMAQGVPILDPEGNVREWMGSLLDIDERKQAEAELRQKNAILDAVNESAPTPIFVKDRQGRIIYANPATLEVLGKSASEVIGYRDCDLYPNAEDAARVMENDQRIMESGQTEVVEESPDGIRIFLGMKAPYCNEAGEVIGLIGISNDITDRVQLERDRERILQQEQAAREAAEAANKIKDEFLAVLSHELRSPLNPILGWTRLLQKGKLDAARQVEALATIERNAKLQAQLIEDLLDISRIMQGKLTLTAAPTSLTFVISAAVETVRLAAEAKNIQITFDLDPMIASISGDAARLQQVVWNLLTNAVKFTPSGGQVTVELRQLDWLAQIRVMDTGIGINPQFLPYVFEYFRQEDASTTRRFGGLGLGLAIVRQIVEMHGGTIRAESQGENQGATFIVQLPIMQQAESIVSEPTRTQAETEAPLNNIQILLVDDDPDTREVQAFLLEQNGAKVTAVASGLEALQVLEQFIPAVIVSDVGMAEMDGYMLVQQIRSRPASQGGQIPVIALTAYAGEFNQQQALQAGFQQHLAKPIEPDKLIRAVATLIGNRND